MKALGLLTVLATLLARRCVQAQAVFAHFMVGNTANFTVTDWETNMALAIDAHIDAFALNMASGWYKNHDALALAFQAAQRRNFKLFFSFDYAGNGSWSLEEIRDLVLSYGGSAAYYQYNSLPLVSTFEGPGNADDWITIKQQAPCFFIPDWSSLGARPALAAGGGVADGLFSWAAWPYGKDNMTTYVDASYVQALNGKPYMMPVSPWFYTNLPGYGKNWLWKGDNLWYDRWLQVWHVKPEFVQIISWNDYGESHYIGPLDDRQYEAFDIGRAPYNYAEDMPHDGWRAHLPFMIDTYKNLNPSVGTESMVVWFRKTFHQACGDGRTTGNTASQLQLEYKPSEVLGLDSLFVAVLLEKEDGTARAVRVTAGSDNVPITWLSWDYIPPDEGVGIWQMHIPFHESWVDSPLKIELVRLTPANSPPQITIQVDGLSNTCPLGLTNWNPIAVSGVSNEGSKQGTAGALSTWRCREGFARSIEGHFNELCQFSCKLGYCPLGACVCTSIGLNNVTRSPIIGQPQDGYPANGDANYAGLCSFACGLGFCPPHACSTAPQPQYIPDNSPFSNIACIAGHSHDQFAGLCSYACAYGFCPMHVCACHRTGYLVVPPAPTGPAGVNTNGQVDDAGLCNFACARGYCPEPCAYDVDVYFDDKDFPCTEMQKAMIRAEFAYAYDMAVAARDNVQLGGFYDRFFAAELRDRPGFANSISQTFGRMAQVLSGNYAKYRPTVRCEPNSKGCKKGWLAHMNSAEKTMNICPPFFGPVHQGKETPFTGTAIANCDKADLRYLQRSKSSILLHEASHTWYAMGRAEKALGTLDYAYGYNGCSKLALGTFDRSCVSYGRSSPLCPDNEGKEGVCDATVTANNADTYTFVGTGVYFSKRCGHLIPFPESEVVRSTGGTIQNSTTRRHTRDMSVPEAAHAVSHGLAPQLQPRVSKTTCPIADYIVFDGDETQTGSGIAGYVHFGDSYASGMGTGTTTSDSCRIGSSNYGDLLNRYLNEPSIAYNGPSSCSGDTIQELINRIQAWSNPADTTLATLTIGGNDVGFKDLVWDCVLTPFIGSQPQGAHTYREKCVKNEQKAIAYMDDTTIDGLAAKLTDVYLRILNKGYDARGRAELELYVAGYPEFFNTDTSDCERTTFFYWSPAYDPWTTAPRLTRELRIELNDLVHRLNTVIQNAVEAANDAWGGTKVHYVDLTERFRASPDHRWCSSDNVHEPDEGRQDTWFFLSAWADVNNDASATGEAAERQAIIDRGHIPLPDETACAKAGAGSDPWLVWMCRVAEDIRANPAGNMSAVYASANEALANGDFGATDIGWFTPTRQAKTFHPRTPGMYAYRDAVIEQMQAFGQI